MYFYFQYGNTPLHLAARGGHTEIVQLLLDSKADPECINDVSVLLILISKHYTN